MTATIFDRFSVQSSLAIKDPCRAATTGNITLSGLQTIDGVALAVDDRVLVAQQSDDDENGIYTVRTDNWARAIDLGSADDFVEGTLVMVTEGTQNGGVLFWMSPAE